MVETLFKLSPKDAGVRLSRQEFVEADLEPPHRYERVHGRLTIMAPPGDAHRGVSRPFHRRLGGYWDRNPGFVDAVDEEGWTATSEDTDRLPDLCVYLAGPRSSEGLPHRVPDLIFEFVSSDSADQERDYIDKRAEYHAIGVREYVIVDRFRQQVLVLTWAADDFTEKTLGPNETYTTALLPGLAVSLSEVFFPD